MTRGSIVRRPAPFNATCVALTGSQPQRYEVPTSCNMESTTLLEMGSADLVEELSLRFEDEIVAEQRYCDGIPVLWLSRSGLRQVLGYLRSDASLRFEMLFDLTAIDERVRVNRQGQPPADFTVTYHLMSFSESCDIRLKVALQLPDLSVPTISDLWPNANWYERECWDMFGIK